jgi:hypothetical protein
MGTDLTLQLVDLKLTIYERLFVFRDKICIKLMAACCFVWYQIPASFQMFVALLIHLLLVLDGSFRVISCKQVAYSVVVIFGVEY